jgi:hypothetical protein
VDAAHSGEPTPAPTSCTRIKVLEHMSGIDAAREFVAEARRILGPKVCCLSSCPIT